MTTRRDFIRMTLVGTALLGLPPILFPRKVIAQAAAALLDPATQSRFVNPLPNPLDPSFIYLPTAGTNEYEITVSPTIHHAGLVGADGATLETPVWAYGTPAQGFTVPGRTFLVERGKPITVTWKNELVDDAGMPVQHPLPVDQSIPVATIDSGVPIAVHQHGGNTQSPFDGGPTQWVAPRRLAVGPGGYVPPYQYENAQEAALIWYHDHAEGITRLNVAAGLAGLYVIRDVNEKALIAARKIPSGPYEIPLVIQDRMFTADGAVHYPADPADTGLSNPESLPNPSHLPEFFGDIMLVNGVAWPVLEVEPRRYRLRFLNGSDSRFYAMAFSSGLVEMKQIGTDLGFLNRPVGLATLTMGPGERADVVVNFGDVAGQTIILGNTAGIPYPNGPAPMPDEGPDQIMAFKVTKPKSSAPKDLFNAFVNLRPGNPLPEPTVPLGTRVRKLILAEGTDEYNRLMTMLGIIDPNSINDGTLFFNDPITEEPVLGSSEVWEFYNASVDAHPVHLHLVQFRILDRQRFTATAIEKPMGMGKAMGAKLTNVTLRGDPKRPKPNEAGLKDTVVCPPGQVTRILVPFNREGEFVYHCHILSHEDHEMMRTYRVVKAPPAI